MKYDNIVATVRIFDTELELNLVKQSSFSACESQICIGDLDKKTLIYVWMRYDNLVVTLNWYAYILDLYLNP